MPQVLSFTLNPGRRYRYRTSKFITCFPRFQLQPPAPLSTDNRTATILGSRLCFVATASVERRAKTRARNLDLDLKVVLLQHDRE